MRGTNSLTEPKKPCNCLPQWLHGSYDCKYCNEKIPVTEASFATTVTIPCGCSHTKVHFCTMLLHKTCVDLWQEKMKNTKRDRLITTVPLSCDMLAANLPLVAKLQLDCLREHKLTGIMCETCHVREQEQCKFAKCSKCRQVAYCCVDCQKDNWKTHKLSCKKPTSQKKLTLDEFEATDTTVMCKCMSYIAKEYTKRANTNRCSNPK